MKKQKAKQPEVVEERCPEFPWFGATYPDATCIDGQLYDLDDCDDSGRLYKPSAFYPCPFCNTKLFLKEQKDNENDLVKVKEWIEETRRKYLHPISNYKNQKK